MKKITSVLMSLLMLSGVISIPSFAEYEKSLIESTSFLENDHDIIIITDKDEIKRYQEYLGEEYDPNLVAIKRVINKSTNDKSNMTIVPFLFFRDYYIKNKRSTKYTDFNNVLRTYNRPAGRISINEGVSITTSFTADAGIKADFLELELGFSVSSTDTFEVEWSGNYSYPVTIEIFPIYEKITGEVWDKDIKYDDYIGKFTVKRALGDEIRVRRR